MRRIKNNLFINKISLCISLAVILLFSSQSLAQEKTSVNAHQIESSVSIDGRLDEEAWNQAEIATDFRQFSPDEGEVSTQNTEVRILYGDGGIYVGAMLHDDNPSEIERALGRRDDYNRADWFIVSFDSRYNRQNAFTFGINAAGIQYDGIRSSGGFGGGPGIPGVDESWDAVWYSDVSVTNEGWIVEMQIPYSMLRFSETDVQTWGIHFTRNIPRLGEVTEWPLVPRVERDNLIAQFGLLQNIRNVEPKPNIQVRPYMVSGFNSGENPTDPGEVATDTNIDVGGDIKVGLGPNVTLDATINPDFGQVEADPAVLNLTAFETFFQEQRPFFVEGIEIYEFSVGRGELLYTRRIGAEDPIIGATKLSGRTEKGLSFGVLGAMTGDEFDPSRNYGVARASQQIGDFSTIGGILTFYDSPFRGGDGRRRTYSGGTDWDLRFADNNYGIDGYASFTHRRLTANDETETGFAGKLFTEKRQGAWRGFVGAEVFSDDFNPNDLGQLRQNNYIVAIGRIEHQINGGRPFGAFQQADLDAFITQSVSYDEGLDLGLGLRTGSNWTFKSFQSIGADVNVDKIFGGYDLFETRGLGPYAQPFSAEFEFEFETDERRPWQLSPEAAWTYHDDGGNEYALGLRGNWNVGSRLDLFANVEGEWERAVTAWTSNESFRRSGSDWFIGETSAPPSRLSNDEYRSFDDGGELSPILSSKEPFGDNAYYVPVFGERDTRSIDFTFRSTVTFTQNLSLQIYNQLFLARGKYENFKILQDRDNLADFSSYPKRDEFSFNSFLSNMVIRWEYRPGSTIFLVWSHGRNFSDELNPLSPYGSSPYDRPIGTQINDTFDILPDNSILLKINYTFLY
ncbi:MAG: DUF5916 domain-containing protein [Balneolaceae bacterium]|nr:DUF5916 domain-containing protein [Balneolaceae bacterium]